jgi:hypothetical protein
LALERRAGGDFLVLVALDVRAGLRTDFFEVFLDSFFAMTGSCGVVGGWGRLTIMLHLASVLGSEPLALLRLSE